MISVLREEHWRFYWNMAWTLREKSVVGDTVMYHPGFPLELNELFLQLYGVLLSGSNQLSSFLRNYLHWRVILPEAMAPSQGTPYSITDPILRSHTNFSTPLEVNWDLFWRLLSLFSCTPSLSFHRCWSQEHSLINFCVLIFISESASQETQHATIIKWRRGPC